ncbi:MAG: hypothetical protein ACRDDY_14985 [Clostridium sp.]|uniref:hypothetical protein n=1 Tax=Clostridium sp. TaxID=1506 RepID=UPI003EE7205E
MQEGIDFLEIKMQELNNKIDKLDNKKNYDERRDLIEKLTFLDEIITEMKKKIM